MPKFKDVVGSIMRDITEARVLADNASSAICRQYEKDDILKHFPIPRVEIKDIEIDLKFAINQISKDNILEADIIVDAEKLNALPQNSISSAKFNIGIKNYQWANVQEDQRVVKKLIAE